MSLTVPNPAPPVPLPDPMVLLVMRERWQVKRLWFREMRVPLIAEDKFKRIWEANKPEFLRRGYGIAIHSGAMHLFQWLDKNMFGAWILTEHGTKQAMAIKKPVQTSLQFTEEPVRPLILDPLPGRLESYLRGYQVNPTRQLFRAIKNGNTEWGYPGAIDASDKGTGKTFMDLATALASGRSVVVLCPSVGQAGWQRAFQHFGATPRFIGTYEAIRGGWRPEVVTLDESGRFTWRHASEIFLILDEAQYVRHSESLTSTACFAAIRQGIPMITASATLAINPIELRFAGRITGLHRGEKDWDRFLAEHGCEKKTTSSPWVWTGDLKSMAKINHRVYPWRGARVTKQSLGSECPETEIALKVYDTVDADRIEAKWQQADEIIARLERQGDNKGSIERMRQKLYMRVWQEIEMVLTPLVAHHAETYVKSGFNVAIFMNYTASREKMGAMLGTKAGFFGGQSIKVRQEYERAFQANEIHYLISNIKSGGASVSLHDLHGRPRVSFVFPTDNPVDFDQALGRIDRVGGVSKSIQWIPTLKGTITKARTDRARRKALAISMFNDGHTDNAIKL